jgi:hypothetical protein
MSAYRGADGTVLWHSDATYDGPPILYHDRIITQTGGSNQRARPARSFYLLTGQPVKSRHPLTGDPIPWEWVRFKGCNTAIASEHLLTFRSASGAYADLSCITGTTSIGGFKSGCTSNLVVADGVLNAPDYTRTCTCSYQNQTSLALVHFPADDPWYPTVESWRFDFLPAPQTPRPVKRVGINFGAPGNRMTPEGTLWLEYPSVGGPSPDIPVHVAGESLRLFRHHASQVETGRRNEQMALIWVGASGLAGIKTVTIRPFVQPVTTDIDERGNVQAFAKNAHIQSLDEIYPEASGRFKHPQLYTVRLYLGEMEAVPEQRPVFDILLQGEPVLENLDGATLAKGSGTLVKEFKHVPVEENLTLSFQNKTTDTTAHQIVICGIELISEEERPLPNQ